MGDSNSRPDGPKPMSKPSGRTVSHSLALSGTPAVPLWNSIGLFISATAFGFWDLCGIEFCILKVLPTGFTSNSGCFLPQRAAQKLRRINKEISAMTKRQQADLDDSQPAVFLSSRFFLCLCGAIFELLAVTKMPATRANPGRKHF